MRRKEKKSLFLLVERSRKAKKSNIACFFGSVSMLRFISAPLNERSKPNPNGRKCSEFFRVTTGNCSVRFDTALENEPWFEQTFIGSGIFHDFRDGFNINEPDDNVQGVTIRQMYNALTPNATNLCRYLDELLNQNPFLNFADINEIYIRNDAQRCDI